MKLIESQEENFARQFINQDSFQDFYDILVMIHANTIKRCYKYLQLDFLCTPKLDERHMTCSYFECNRRKCGMCYISQQEKFLIDISNNIFILFKFMINNAPVEEAPAGSQPKQSQFIELVDEIQTFFEHLPGQLNEEGEPSSCLHPHTSPLTDAPPRLGVCLRAQKLVSRPQSPEFCRQLI